MNSLSPVKDLEQPLSVSFSSSTQTGGDEEEDGGRVEEERREELEEEDAELKSPCPSFTVKNPSPSLCVSVGAPPHASIPATCPRSGSAPESRSMTYNLFSSGTRITFCSVSYNTSGILGSP